MTIFPKVSINFPAEIGSPDFHFDINGMAIPGLLSCRVEKEGVAPTKVTISFFAEVTSFAGGSERSSPAETKRK